MTPKTEPRRPLRVLVVEDDADARAALAALLEARGVRAASAATLKEAATAVTSDPPPELVLLDLGLPDGDGMALFDHLDEGGARPGVIVLTGERSLERAVEAMRHGALDYLTKPLRPEALRIAIDRAERALLDSREQRTLRRALARHGHFQGMVGRSSAMAAVYDRVERAAPSRIPVFVLGESGTGKELLARAVHRLSPRRARPFVALNCGAIPAELVESELFGHERGAFTGAQQRHEGVFEQADGGILFLDELPEMPLESQVKLLRVLETGVVRRVGGSRDIAVDVRVVSATNRDPEAAVAEGRLREDLFYRLHVLPIELPPLRERPEDIPLLAAHFLAADLADGEAPPTLSAASAATLAGHDWPGNVRELRNAMQSARVLAGGDDIEPEHLPPAVQRAGKGGRRPVQPGDRPADRDDEAQRLVPFGATLREAERILVETYLRHHGGHRERTARALGVTPKTLYNKIRAWGIDPDSFSR